MLPWRAASGIVFTWKHMNREVDFYIKTTNIIPMYTGI
jgi:hypothetical protein